MAGNVIMSYYRGDHVHISLKKDKSPLTKADVSSNNYIINENDIDGIPNRKINCSNKQEFSLRTAIYEMSVAEADVLRTHEKVESVELNPDKYPQPQSTSVLRYKKNVAFNKPILTNAYGTESTGYTNGVRSNWSHLFVNNPSSKPFQGVGIAATYTVDRDVSYSLTGKNVDTVTIDSGIGAYNYILPALAR